MSRIVRSSIFFFCLEIAVTVMWGIEKAPRGAVLEYVGKGAEVVCIVGESLVNTNH